MAPFAAARAVLELAPWGGESLNDDNPDAPVRSLVFGPTHQGLITYRQRRVDVLDVLSLS
ncbi:MAG: hypothetical protein ACRDRA_19115 [Pseudonocardiaceae bacterium]